MPNDPLHLTRDLDANKLLGRDPLALLIGMVLDQQVPMERAFKSPYDLLIRMSPASPAKRLDASEIASYDPERMSAIFSESPALHRFPGSMAERVQAVCAIIASKYNGKADALWKTAKTGDELIQRLSDLPGFGPQKAKIFAALLAKQLGIRPDGWKQATDPYGQDGTYISVADVSSPEAFAKVKETKKAMKAAQQAK